MTKMNYGSRFNNSTIVGAGGWSAAPRRARPPTWCVSWYEGQRWQSKRYQNEALAWEQASVTSNRLQARVILRAPSSDGREWNVYAGPKKRVRSRML